MLHYMLLLDYLSLFLVRAFGHKQCRLLFVARYKNYIKCVKKKCTNGTGKTHYSTHMQARPPKTTTTRSHEAGQTKTRTVRKLPSFVIPRHTRIAEQRRLATYENQHHTHHMHETHARPYHANQHNKMQQTAQDTHTSKAAGSHKYGFSGSNAEQVHQNNSSPRTCAATAHNKERESGRGRGCDDAVVVRKFSKHHRFVDVLPNNSKVEYMSNHSSNTDRHAMHENKINKSKYTAYNTTYT